ncbi:MAG: PKD domain-containing protein, partial [Bacteroidota bacterium]
MKKITLIAFLFLFPLMTMSQTPYEARINFQNNPSSTIPPMGYLADYGKEFGNISNALIIDTNTYTFGWKLLSNGTPIDVSEEAAGNSNGAGRNRISGSYASATDQEKLEGTLVHFQGDNIASWSAQPRGNELFWELEIPNGIYSVTIGLGDNSASVDSRHSATVEGYTIIPAFEPTSNEVRVATMIVEVTDGLLTINGFGGYNSKITHLEVTESTGTPVSGVFAFNPNTTSETLESGASDSFNSDLWGAGATVIGMIINDNLTASNDWLTLPGTLALGTLNFGTSAIGIGATETRDDKIIATAAGFTPAELDADLSVTAVTPTFPLQVNFQNEGTTPPVGYFKDYGLPYGPNEGGLVYGWIKLSDGLPIDLTTPSSGVGRNRGDFPALDVLQETLVHMQGNDIAGWTGNRSNEGVWEVDVPNGWYEVVVSVGDANQDGQLSETPDHFIRAEGQTVIPIYDVDSSLPNGDPGRFTTGTLIVEVTDGKLTIDADDPGANNTKINSVVISESTAPLSTETDITSFTLTEDGSAIATINTLNHTVAIQVVNGTGLNPLTPTIGLSAGATITPLSGVAQDFSAPFDYTVTAEDGLTSQVWTITVTEAPTSGFAFIENFDTYGTGDLETISGGAWVRENTGNTQIPVVAEGLTPSTTNSLDFNNITTVHDYQTLINNPVDLIANVPFYFGTYFKISDLGPDESNRIRVAIRVDDNVAGDQWVRQRIGRYGGEFAARLGLGGSNSNDGETVIYPNQLLQFVVRGEWDGAATITYSYTIAPTLVEGNNTWIAAGSSQSVTGTPSLGRIFISSTSTGNNGNVGPIRLSTNYADVVTEVINSEPLASFMSVVTDLDAIFDATASTDDGSIVNYEWDFGNGDSDNTGGATVNYSYPTPGNFTVTLTVTDDGGLTDVTTNDITVTGPTSACNPLSPLDCEDVEVSLPLALDFSGSVANTILDSGGLGTGFTAVLEHSEARRAGDLPISDLNLNGYEPSLLNLSGGNLQILSQAGIAFRKPGGSTNNNNQVNTLGVGLDNLGQSIIIKTTLLNIVTGGSAAQAGLWFGFDEDNFVKLDVNNDNVELRVESDGLSGNGTTGTDQVQTNVGASGNNVLLELIINPTTLTAEAYYTIGAGNRTQLGSLPIPANYFTGRDINAGGAQDNMSFAGIYATHRNGAQFTASFDDFSVEEVAPSTETDIVSFTLPQQTSAASIDAVNHTVDIEVTNGTGLSSLTPTIGLSEGATISPLSGTQQDFSAPLDFTVTAEDGTTTQIWSITVTEATSALPYEAHINFQDNPSSTTPPVGYLADYGKEFGNASVTIDAVSYQYGWKLLADGTPIDVSDEAPNNSIGVGRNRIPGTYDGAPLQDQLEGTLVHYQGDNIDGWADGQPRKNELFWEIEIPNGIYEVTLGLGDKSTSIDSHHTATLEGFTIIAAFVPTATEVRVATMIVEVTDGLLTINGLGGFNSKITHIDIVESTGSPVNGVLSFTPNTVNESLESGTTGSFSVDLAGEGATDFSMIIDNFIDPTNDWLSLPGTIALGTLSFNTDASTLLENDTRSNTIIATSAGFSPAVLEADLNVTGGLSLSFDLNSLSFSGSEGEIIAPQTVNLAASSGSPTIILSDDPDASSWLVLPSSPQLGSIEFGIQENVPAGTYSTTIFAIDQPDEGYANAEITISLVIGNDFSVNVNFSDAATPPPSGYEQDSGLGYGPRGNGFTYGWLTTDGISPLDLTANTRNRDITGVDVLQNTLNHMQYGDTGGTNGNSTEGIWEIEVPNGTYSVTVGAGDPSVDGVGDQPTHRINVEGITIIDDFVPSGAAGASTRWTMASGIVTVNDGRMTFDANGGFNTKINYVGITSNTDSLSPRIIGVIPTDNATGVSVNTNISANNLFLPNGDSQGVFGVDNATITSATVQLFKQGNATPIAATVNGTGGGDAINLDPVQPLEANTIYVFRVDGVEDTTGAVFEFFESTFTTGSGNTGGNTDLDNVSFSNEGVVGSNGKYTTLTIGPDDKLYALKIDGDIHRWEIAADGTLINEEILTAWKSSYASRAAIGLTFDPNSTSGNLIAYISHQSGGLSGAPEWDGKISRISGDNLQTEEVLLTDLPRSIRDHLTNSIAFRPGEPNVFYFNQGSNSAAGAPDGAWGNRPERLLSAATLRLDLSKLPGTLPLNVRTTQNIDAIKAVNVNSPTLDGLYNPYYVDAALTLFGTGIRNAYDLVWHTNGQLYVPTNGTAGGSNAPASIDDMRRPDGTFYDHDDISGNYPIVPASNGNNTQRDWLFRLDPNSTIGYYGHPNPFRGEFVLNRGDVDVSNAVYNGVVPDVNYRGAAFDFEFNKSPNGVIEYRSSAENGNLQGAILVCRYSGGSDLIALVPDGPNGDIGTFKVGIPGFGGFQDPLDLVEDVSTGNLYVSDYGRSQIVLLKPNNAASPSPVIVTNTDTVVGDAVASGNVFYEEEILLSNLGNANLENIQAQISGTDSGDFSIIGLPTSITPQNSESFTLRFDPSSIGPKFAELTLSGTDADPVVIALQGLGKIGIGGSSEPSLQWILDTYLGQGVVDVGDTDSATNIIDLPNGLSYNDLLGDEVDAQIFARAVDAPITIEVLSVYGPTSSNPIVAFGWYPSGDASTTNELFTVDNTPTSNGQTLNPPVNGALQFDPGIQSFGFYNRWPFFGNRELFSEDALNTFNGAIPHHIRVYEVPGETNAYIIATEEHVSGFDYQDVVVIARNVRPASDDPVGPFDIVRVNFSRAQDTPPSGYEQDAGLGYGPRANNLTFGWLTTDGLTPLNLSANARNREINGLDILQNTLIHMQYGDTAGSNGNSTEGIWEIEVPNGNYTVDVQVGDPTSIDSQHSINVEGINIIDKFIPSGAVGEATRFSSASTTVDVADGRLTIDAFGGTNTKIIALEITPNAVEDLPPLVTVELDGPASGQNTFTGPVTVTIGAESQNESDITTLEYQLNGGNFTPYTENFVVSAEIDHVLIVRAIDGNDNTTEETIEFTIAPSSGALLAIENMTKVPGTDRGFPADDYFTFHRIGTNLVTEQVHDTNVMRINSTGTSSLVVSEINFDDTNYDAVITNASGAPTTLPITIPAGSFADVELVFVGQTPNGGTGTFAGDITVVSNADNGLEGVAVLHAAYSPQSQGNNEINAQEVFDAFGFQTSMRSIVNDQGTITPPNNNPLRPSSNFPDENNINAGYEGDLILADAFVQANPNEPVIGLQISALHGPGSAAGKFIQVNGTAVVAGINFLHSSAWFQTLLPRAPSTGIINSALANTITDPFRIAIADYLTTGGNNLNGDRPDLLGARVYKVIDHNGNIIPNEYIVLQDYIGDGCGAGSANCDYNDNTFYFINIRPQAVPSAGALDAVVVTENENFSVDFLPVFDIGYAGNVLEYSASYESGALPSWIQFNAQAGTISGTPPVGTEGSFLIEISGTDSNNLSANTSLTITINEPPLAVDDTVVIAQNTTTDLTNLLENDSEPNGETLNIISVSDPTNGTAILDEETDVVTYTPDLDYLGPDSFTYTIEDESGLTATATVNITVTDGNQPPIAVATANPTSGQVALFVEFFGDTSSDDNNTIVQYEWNFGDGSANSFDVNTNHTFTSTGVYNVVLTVTDEIGLTDTDTVTITVSSLPNNPPTAVATSNISSGNVPLNVDFNASNSNDDNGIVTYLWDFGDGSATSDLITPMHTYQSIGTFTATLTVTDAQGESDSDTIFITVSDSNGGPCPDDLINEDPSLVLPSGTFGLGGDTAVGTSTDTNGSPCALIVGNGDSNQPWSHYRIALDLAALG